MDFLSCVKAESGHAQPAILRLLRASVLKVFGWWKRDPVDHCGDRDSSLPLGISEKS